MHGYIKFYIPVNHPRFTGGKLVCIGTVHCDYDERDKVAVEFVKMNKNLPIVEATFTCNERVSLNFI